MTHAESVLSSCDRWAAAWSPPDRRPIYEWARENIILPDSYSKAGPFQPSGWMLPVFDALQNMRVRRVHLRKAVQQAGTLVADVWLQWIINNDPGPVSWTMQKDDAMGIHLKTRVWPTMEACKATRAKLPPEGKMRTLEAVYFGGFFVIFTAANVGSQQSVSIRYKINDEIWMDKWQDVYADAIARVTAYEREGISKIFNVSQAGVVDDIEDKSFRDGDQGELNITCPHCGKSTPLVFDILREDKSHAGIVWNPDAKGADGLFNVARAMETCRYQCLHCRGESLESEKTRQQWNSTHHFISANLGAPEAIRSFHIESLTNDKMETIVERFCAAFNEQRRGLDDGMKKFLQKYRALPWAEKGDSVDLRGGTAVDAYRYEDYRNGILWDNEKMRFMSIDRQKDHFWVEINAWRENGDSRQILYARVKFIEEAREIQLRYKVKDKMVSEDCGYMPSAAYDDCVRFGWIAFRGERQKEFIHYKNEVVIKNPYYSPMQPIEHKGVNLWKISFSADNCKDVLARIMQGKTLLRRDFPTDVSGEYMKQVNAEQKLRQPSGEWRWQKVPDGAPNHGWDTSVAQIVFALNHGFIKSENEKESA